MKHNKKNRLQKLKSVWQRERDSNPRYPKAQRFSRPPLSTTQPSLCVQEDNILILMNFFNVIHGVSIKLL